MHGNHPVEAGDLEDLHDAVIRASESGRAIDGTEALDAVGPPFDGDLKAHGRAVYPLELVDVAGTCEVDVAAGFSEASRSFTAPSDGSSGESFTNFS